MINSSHYEEHYRTLQLTEDCSWDEIRKSYKKQIQSCHPDRLTDDSSEKADAQEHIKSLNLAYQGLLKYYKEHDSLPRFHNLDDGINARESFTFEPHETSIHHLKKPPKSRNRMAITTGFIVILSAYLFSDFSDKTIPAVDNLNAQKTSSHSKISASESNKLEHSLPQAKNKSNASDSDKSHALNADKKYFNIGSSIGKVMDAQGIPDKNNDNIWYYGKSTITFIDGKVSNWYRDKDTPLNIDVSSAP